MSAEPERRYALLTREREDNAPLRALLEAAGVPVLEIPCTRIVFTAPAIVPDRADALAFTSRRGVDGFFSCAACLRLLEGTRPLVGAVGSATAARLGAHGVAADVVADPQTGEALGRALSSRLEAGARVAVVRGSLEAGGLEPSLRAAGIAAEPVEVYENRGVDLGPVARFPLCGALVASPSAAARLFSAAPWIADAAFFALGPTTAAALGDLGAARISVVGPEVSAQARALIAAHGAGRGSEET